MKTFFTSLGLVLMLGLSAQSTATNFSCNDCAGNPHDLFTELDTGDVIVISWIMPCGSCIAPTLTAHNIVQSYASTFPGRVKMYVVDDVANSSCTVINSWTATNNMPIATEFSNAAIDMSDYGTAGMPKIVVLGGQWHKVYYNSNGAGNATALQTAIDSALAQTGVQPITANENSVVAYPVPSCDNVTLTFSSIDNGTATIDIYSVDGKKVKETEQQSVSTGVNNLVIGTAELSAGIYTVTVIVGDLARRTQIVIE